MAKTNAGKGGGQRSPSELGGLLKSAGLRKTVPRIGVLQFMDRATKPLSHAEVAEEMAVLGLDRATVYRILMDFVEAGLATRSDRGDHVWRFEMAQGGTKHAEEHPHFVCVTCGGVTCLPEGTVRVAGRRGLPRALASSSLEVQLKGECDSCATK
jgi:Fur family ferric uptake transcriptional regulator